VEQEARGEKGKKRRRKSREKLASAEARELRQTPMARPVLLCVPLLSRPVVKLWVG